MGLLSGWFPWIATAQTSGRTQADSALVQRLYNRCLTIEAHNRNGGEALAHQLVAIGRQRGVPLASAHGYFLLGKVYADKGNYAVGIRYELRALPIYQAMGRGADMANVYREMSLIYRQMAASSEGKRSADSSVRTRPQFTHWPSEARIGPTGFNDLLRNTSAGWLTGAGLLALLLFVSYQHYVSLRMSRNRTRQQAMQMQLLVKELHHRVKTNLAMASGLLELQVNRLHDGEARQMLQEGQQRVQAMALIHQRLGQTNAIATIHIREYIEQLTHSLMHAHHYTADLFELQISVQISQLDADTAIPVGLILNELLINAFKHTYPHVVHPILQITLDTTTGPNGCIGLLLDVVDNGPGLDQITWSRSGGMFGKRLIYGLAEQIGAKITVDSRNGLSFRLHVPASGLVIA